MSDLPAAARLVAWGNAALQGAVSLDEATDGVVGSDPPHRVAGLPGEDGQVGISLALGRLRAGGATTLRLVLPVTGDPTGLPGPVALNELAVELGEVALTSGRLSVALLPEARAAWTVHAALPSAASLMSVAEAEQLLREEIRESTSLLTRLDVAREDPDAVAELRGRSRSHPPLLPLAYPARAHALLASAQQVGDLSRLAGRTPGAAVSAQEMAARASILRRLLAASRRGVEAACNALVA